jgi:hypothetical protein
MAISSNTTAGNIFTPTEVLYDPTNKLRVASPQSLIDTDFEYGTQSSKWESLGLIDNRPFAYSSQTGITNISSITQNTNSRTVTVALSTVTATPNAIAASTPATGFFQVTTAAAHGFQPGQYVTLSGVTTTLTYNDTWLIYSVPSTTTFLVQSTVTGTATFSSAQALAGVAPKNFTPIVVQDTFLVIANGNFIIESGGGTASFTYTARASNSTGITAIYDSNKTAIYLGAVYANASIGVTGSATFTLSGNKVTVATSVPHGLAIGNEVAITGITGTNPPNGAQIISQIQGDNTFSYYVVGGAPSALTTSAANVYVRPQAQFLHRPFDGGVMFSSNASSNYEQAIRQTRRYFRYQSGKGIQMSSGTVLKPTFQVDSLTSSGTTVTVQTKEKHNLQPGANVTIAGANETAYNGTFPVSSVTGYNTFTYTALTTPSASPASGDHYTAITSWTGAVNRLGIFDSQNGLFWEYDGTTLSAVRRNSTYQIGGKVSVVNGSTTVQQTNASFATTLSRQLNPGDYIVIRGQSYRVTDISSDRQMTISPAYRGASAQYVVISKTIDTKVPQSSFNIDKLDGTGATGYNIDLTKMQMFYIDYTWYGAGFVRWGVRGPNGTVTYAHKLANNNTNNEAYMRSGNLPGRYEVNTMPPYTKLTASITSSDTTIPVTSTTGFPTPVSATQPGVLCLRGNSGTTISITGITNSGTQVTYATASTTGLAVGQTIDITGATSQAYNGQYAIVTVNANTSIVVNSTASGSTSTATGIVQVNEYVNYTGLTATSFTGVTREVAGQGTLALTIAAGSNSATVGSATALQVGQRLVDTTNGYIPEGTFIAAINGTTLTLSQAATGSNPTVVAIPMGNGVGQAFTYSATSPVSVEYAFPTFAPSLAHWGTSVIMDGRFDDDKSLLFTYGQSTFTGIAAGGAAALMSIRVSPSVDNGIPAAFGSRELINRMQLVLRALDITTKTGGNLLITAILNGVPSTATTWTNAVRNSIAGNNSSLAQIADYAGGSTRMYGGEVTGGFFVSGTGSIDLERVRDLGTSILGGGGATSDSQIYPDGPDVLTIYAQNIGTGAMDVTARLSWSEAQA